MTTFEKHKTIILQFFTVFILFSLVLVVHLRLRNQAFDDAYIHFRIARNFVDSGVPYFNPDERVMASSSTGWTIVVAGLFLLIKNPLVILFLNAIATVSGAVVFSCALSNKWDRFIYAIMYIGLMLPVSIGLMETPLTLLLVSISYFLFIREKPFALAIFGILPFFRLELTFLSVIFLLYALISKKFTRKQTIFIPLFTAIPFLIFDLTFFHTIIPNTVYAKTAGYTLDHITSFLMAFAELIPGTNIRNIFFFILFVPPTVFWGWRNRDWLSRPERLLLLSGLVIIIFYTVGKTFIFEWYGPLYSILILIPAAKGFLQSRKLPALISFIVYTLPTLFSFGNTIVPALANPTSFHLASFEARVPVYIEIGRRLYQKYPDASLMTSEIGGLGWGFEGYVFDGFGLASPDAIHHHTDDTGNVGIIPLSYIKEKNPEIIVSLSIFIRDFMDSPLMGSYKNLPVNIFPDGENKIWGDTKIDVFVRSDLLNLGR